MRKLTTTLLICIVAVALSANATSTIGAPIQIMPLGDSITNGVNVAGGYRAELYQRLTNAGVSFQFVGSDTESPTATLTNAGQDHHEGHNGIQVDQLEGNLDGNTNYTNGNGGYWFAGTGARAAVYPNVILLMCGINDIDSAPYPTVSTVTARMNSLLNHIFQDRPNVAVILASLTPLAGNNYTAWNSKVTAYNASLPGLVSTYASQGHKAYFLDMHSKLNNSPSISSNPDLWNADGLHPSQSGYNKMGDAWFDAMQSNGLLVSTPEPSSLTLLACGCAGLLWYARRKRRGM
ncbi:MAG: SGNH/GDSL hydrolase family protein [Thermoguttaceae bacterium]